MKLEIRSDGGKEGTKILLDGVEQTTKHLKRLVWEFDFPFNEATVGFEYLPPIGYSGLPFASIIRSDCIEVALCLDGLGAKG